MLREQFRNEVQEILSPNGAKSQLPAKEGRLYRETDLEIATSRRNWGQKRVEC